MKFKKWPVVIIFLIVAGLSGIFLWMAVQYKQKEVEDTSRVYDSLILKFHDVSMSHLSAYYASELGGMVRKTEMRAAVSSGDREGMRRLALDQFARFLKRNPAGRDDGSFLKEINFYTPDRRLALRVMDPGDPDYRETHANPNLAAVLAGDKENRDFYIDSGGLYYRLLAPAMADDGLRGVWEFVVDPFHFCGGVDEMLDLSSAIVMRKGQLEKTPRDPRWMNHDNYFWRSREAVFNNVMEVYNWDSLHQQVDIDSHSYIAHNILSFKNNRGEILAKIVAIRDITPMMERIGRSMSQALAGGALALAIVIVLVFTSIRRLARRIEERENQLRVMNEELEQEILERKAIEEELIIHRDHLEGLITEGTRELQIKNQEIEASEKKFRTITFSVSDAIVMTDNRGYPSFVNKSFTRIFGFRPDEIQGKELLGVIAPDSDERKTIEEFNIFRTPQAEGVTTENIEINSRRKNGEAFPIEINAATVDIQGDIYTVAIIRDITHRKEGEREVRVLSRAIEQSSVMVMITDTSGLIEYVNQKFCEVTGYTRDDVMGRSFTMLDANMRKPEFYRDLWSILKSGKDWQGELYNKKKNGDLYWEFTRISPIKDGHGKITHFVVVKEDITLRKRMEIELLAAKKSAEAASRSKSEFLANMSHELRTPMNAIIGMTDLVLDTHLSQEQREYLKIVQQSSNALLHLLNDILDLSRIEAGKLNLEPLPFSIRESLAESAKVLGHQAYKKNLELVYHIDSEVPDQIIGDEARLKQILMNLIGNSIKFTEQGEIVLTVEVLEEFDDGRLLLHFMVSDTGIGVPEKKLESIFEKFYQADASITRKYGGSGLGLAITSTLVRLMDGIIWAESPATFPHFTGGGPGSTFHFTASFDINPKVARTKKNDAVVRLKNLPLLIVDDNETNRRFLKDILSRWGLKPETASSGSEALNILKERNYSLLILDFQMPEMDGGTLLERIRNDQKSDVPVILLSSGLHTQDLNRINRLGIAAHFFKPVNSQELIDSIMVIMGYQEEEPEIYDSGKGLDERKTSPAIHILVAEDNPINQRLIQRLLEKRGHYVQIAENGRQAVIAHQIRFRDGANPFRLILMDIQMPEMDGIQATHEIRKTDSAVPIIALTAHAMKGDKNKFLAEGMNDYISKPIKKSLLFEIVDQYALKEFSRG